MTSAVPSWVPNATTRAVIAAAAAIWRRGLVDISKGNKRLYYRPLKVGTLDLSDATPEGVERLLAREDVKLSALFPDTGTSDGVVRLARARRAADILHGKSRLGLEETGDNPTRLAIGLASWSDPAALSETRDATETTARDFSAPILLVPVTFTLKPGSRTVSSLQMTGEPELNLALRYVLHAHQEGLEIDDLGWLEEAVDENGSLLPAKLLAAAASLTGVVPGWSVSEHLAVDAFGSDRELMLRDLEDEEVLAAHPLLAAMAGDKNAQALFDAAGVPDDGSDLDLPDRQPPSQEFLVLDADASQQSVIEHALAGRSLVVQGPPGTGKSQTIANLIATASAHGKTVLFVAQKRAAVDAVLGRLEGAGLDDLVLEVFDTRTRRGNVISQLRTSLEELSYTPRPDTLALHRDLAQTRDALVAHGLALHTPRPQLGGGTLFELLGRLAGIGLSAQSQTRVPSKVATAWQGDRTQALAEAIAELVALGGLDPERATRPGWSSEKVVSAELATQAYDAAAALSSELGALASISARALTSAGLPSPTSFAQASAGVSILNQVRRTCAHLNPAVLDPEQVSDADLDQLIACVGSPNERKALPDRLGFFSRRKLRKHLIATHYTGPEREASHETLHEWLTHARELRARWYQWPAHAPTCSARLAPNAPTDLDAALTALEEPTAHLDLINTLTQGVSIAALEWNDATAWTRRLLADPDLSRYPRAHQLRQELTAAGASPVLDQLTARVRSGAPVDPSLAGDYLRWVSWHSALDQLAPAVPALQADIGTLSATEELYADADREHIHANRVRVQHSSAQRLRERLNALPDQQRAVKDQTRRKRGLKSLRQLLEEAPDALLALKPCWAMSPLLVSRYLPATVGLFDLVVMDEASQIVLADAVPSLLRGKQAIVAGDDKQLPPTTIFTKMLDSGYDPTSDTHEGEEDEFSSEEEALERDVDLDSDIEVVRERPDPKDIGVSAVGYDSILGALNVFLPARTLLWHYRSRDERLIATSNKEVYGRKLITFPGATGAEALRHIVVPPSEGLGTNNKSPRAEVDQVVALVLEHARKHAAGIAAGLPVPSIGVIAMGRDHAERIEKAMWAAMESAADRPILVALFDENRDEPAFIKSIERVQGDERDVIILTPGYGPSRDGQMRYQWGPLFGEYGINRVNVAISRARASMTLVTSFTADMLPDRGDAYPGYALVRAFTRYASTAGADDLGTSRAVQMNPFEAEIYDRLTSEGLIIDAQWGVSQYRLDFAVRHPDYDGTNGPIRHVLAIEADGRMWHSGYTARERDRLRQQHLESLGWRFHRIWSTDWFRDPDSELEQAVAAYNIAVTRSRNGDHPADARAEPTGAWGGASTQREVNPAAGMRRPPPWISPGAAIQTYSDAQLLALVRWLREDGVLRLADDELTELIAVLGYRRRGAKIVERLTAAQHAADKTR